MPKSNTVNTIYTKDKIETLRQNLKDYASQPQETYNLQEGIESLLPELLEALKHHPYRDVTKLLNDQGFDIAESSLKKYVERLENSKTGETKQSTTAKTNRSSSSGKSRGRATNKSNQAATDASSPDSVDAAQASAASEAESRSSQAVAQSSKNARSKSEQSDKPPSPSLGNGSKPKPESNNADQKLADQFDV